MRTTIKIYSRSLLCNYLGFSLRQDVDASQTYTKSFRVPLTSIDMNGHMTNSRYHTYMDYLHVSFMMDTGIWEYAFHDGANPMVSAAFVRFRRGLYWRETFDVQFKIVAIRGGWFFSEVQFIKDGFVHCQALRKFGVHKKDIGMIPAHKVLHDLGQKPVTDSLPEYVDLWLKAEESFKEQALVAGL